MDHDELRERVRVLRAKGCSPKEIARTLGTRPATVAALVRTLAAEEMPEPTIECWVSPGWSTGLTVPDHPDWPDVGAVDGIEGLANVLVARTERTSSVIMCSYLVDAYCLGVKNVVGPRVMNSRAAAEFSRNVFDAYPAPPLSV